MNRIKILLVILTIAVVAVVVISLLVSPMLDKRITAKLNKELPDYSFEIEKVHWSLIPSRLSMNTITITSKADPSDAIFLKGEIESIQLKGIKLLMALFKNEYKISEVVISNSHLKGNFPFEDEEKQPSISTINIQIGNLLVDRVNLSLKDLSSSHTISVKEGALKIADLKIKEQDTLGIFHHFDFKAEQFVSVSADSMYTFRTSDIVYSDTSKTLSIEGFSVSPNYNRYDFTARVPYEIDCIEADFSNISMAGFSAANYYNNGNLVSSFISIRNMDLQVFRDKRKKDSNEKRPVFQEYIYSYPGLLHIDSILFSDGNIVYTEHAEKAEKPGRVSMNQLNTRIYNMSNDTIFKTKEASLEIVAEALLMGKSKMTASLKARLFDPVNTFSMKGTLAPMEVKDLNPILEKNAFIYANSAKIDKISFNFIANDTKASGEMIMLYNGLDLAVKNKRTYDTTAFKEQLISLIVNKGAWDSNPLPSEEVRVGIIDFERDPTKFVFNYCLKAIVSGVKSSVIKHPKRKKSFLQKIFSGSFEKQKEEVNN